MNIVLVAPHQWPLPSPAHTGVIVLLDLAIALEKLGHHVTLCAPNGTDFPNVAPMQCSHGQAEPTATHCEVRALRDHKAVFDAADIIHDWSVEKHAAEWYPGKSVSTIMSGNTQFPRHGRNVVTWTNEARERALRGASDYEGTEFTQWHSVSRALQDARVVNGGVDCDFWTPGPVNLREKHLLWLGRWHEARGFALAIDLARQNRDIELVMAGEHPDDATNAHQRVCAQDAVRLASEVPNITFRWLPKEGHREAVRDEYRRARAYLFTPLFHEPFGLSQVEAMACGTPVIATPMGSTKEVVIRGYTGPLVGMADACREWIRLSDGTYQANAEILRKGTVMHFDRSVMAARYAELYAEVAAGGGWG